MKHATRIEVEIEIRAAEIATDAETRAPRKHTNAGEYRGWVHWCDSEDREPRWTRHEIAGYLAAAIFYHHLDEEFYSLDKRIARQGKTSS